MKHHCLTHNGFHSLVKAPVDAELTMQAYLVSTYKNILLDQTLLLYIENFTVFWVMSCNVG